MRQKDNIFFSFLHDVSRQTGCEGAAVVRYQWEVFVIRISSECHSVNGRDHNVNIVIPMKILQFGFPT